METRLVEGEAIFQWLTQTNGFQTGSLLELCVYISHSIWQSCTFDKCNVDVIHKHNPDRASCQLESF
jgi:hypothetical protein